MNKPGQEEKLLIDAIMEISVGVAGLKMLAIDKGIVTEEEMIKYEETAFALISEQCEKNIKENEEVYIKKFGKAAYEEYLEPNLKMARNLINKEEGLND